MERRYAQGLPGQPCPAQRACPVTGAMTGDLSDRSRTEMNELVFKAGGTPRPRPRPMSRPPSGRHTRTPPPLSSPRGPRTPLVLARQVADWAEQAAHRLEDPAQRHPAPRPAGRTAAADATGQRTDPTSPDRPAAAARRSQPAQRPAARTRPRRCPPLGPAPEPGSRSRSSAPPAGAAAEPGSVQGSAGSAVLRRLRAVAWNADRAGRAGRTRTGRPDRAARRLLKLTPRHPLGVTAGVR